jgi:hypothetical protein
MSRGRLPVVWLRAARKSPRALPHTVRRHGGRVGGVVIEAEVPRRRPRRNCRRWWYSTRDIPPDNLRRIVTFAELAGRNADEPTRQCPAACPR